MINARGWLREVLESTCEFESPESYFYWSALTAISAVLKRNIWMERHAYKLYPNIYTFLLSEKSGLRKGPPVKMAVKLVEQTGTVRIIEGINSVQGILKELSKVYTTESGEIIATASGFLASDEFHTFLLEDPKALTILTTLYDTGYHSKFAKRLSGDESGPLTLKEPCITGLFASNDILFKDSVPNRDMRGGFLARSFVVYESEPKLINSLRYAPKVSVDYEKLTEHLLRISKLRGEIKLTEKAWNCYDAWYYPFRSLKNDDDTGTPERIGDSILKAAMLISLTNKWELLVEEDDVMEALERGMECLAAVRKLTIGSGKAVTADATGDILKVLIKVEDHEVSRRKFLQNGYKNFDVYEFDRIMETLVQGKMVTTRTNGNGTSSDIYYKLAPFMVERFNKLMKEEKN